MSIKLYSKDCSVKELSKLDLQDFKQLIGQDNVYWLDFDSPQEYELDFLLQNFAFDPTTILECLDSEHYPKIEDYETYLFFVTFSLVQNSCPINLEKPINSTSEFHEACKLFKTEELNIYLGEKFVVTVHRKPLACLASVIEKTAKSKALFNRGAAFILEEILDALVHTYLPVIEEFDERIDSLEDQVFTNFEEGFFNEIFALKKQITALKKLVLPQQEILFRISHQEHDLIDERNSLLLRNVYDHFVRLSTHLETCRELTSSLFEAFRSQAANRMNEIMKVLTLISTITLPLTLIVGYYGMNFEHLTEFKWAHGVPFVWLLMLVVMVAFYFIFKKRKWL